jgi:hypothetical protein
MTDVQNASFTSGLYIFAPAFSAPGFRGHDLRLRTNIKRRAQDATRENGWRILTAETDAEWEGIREGRRPCLLPIFSLCALFVGADS